ncbi:MAG: Sec-independent protein translocase protein TatB [Steroidobacterales bacterium]
MLDFGFSEVVVTSMIALVVLGPKRLPSVMRRIGNWVGRARVTARQLSEQLEREINAEEILQKTKTTPANPLSVPVKPVTPPPPPAPPEATAPAAATAGEATHSAIPPHE